MDKQIQKKKLYYKENVLCSFVRRMQHGRKTTWTQRMLTHPDKYFYILYIPLLYILRVYVVIGDDLLVCQVSCINHGPWPAILHAFEPTTTALPPIAPEPSCDLPRACDAIVDADTIELVANNA